MNRLKRFLPAVLAVAAIVVAAVVFSTREPPKPPAPRRPPAAWLQVEEDGKVHVRGCGDDVDACLAKASERVKADGPAGNPDCVIIAPPGVPEQAEQAAISACQRANLNAVKAQPAPGPRP